MTVENEARRSRRQGDGRNAFERFVEVVTSVVSHAPFFYVIVIVVALLLWAVSFPFWPSSTKWELAVHTGASVLSLLLLVLLQNAGRRSEEASQEKLNVIASALSDLMESRARDDEDLADSVRNLREAVGLEERH